MDAGAGTRRRGAPLRIAVDGAVSADGISPTLPALAATSDASGKGETHGHHAIAAKRLPLLLGVLALAITVLIILQLGWRHPVRSASLPTPVPAPAPAAPMEPAHPIPSSRGEMPSSPPPLPAKVQESMLPPTKAATADPVEVFTKPSHKDAHKRKLHVQPAEPSRQMEYED